jgi:predicted nucleotidyltransferase
MIDNIFGSKTNILVLRFLSRFKNQFFTPDEVSKATLAGKRNVYDSINQLFFEEILTKKIAAGKTYYSFMANTKANEFISGIFNEENKKRFIRSIANYKLISEAEAKLIKSGGSEIIDIMLFGSAAKGTDTEKSDIDLCVIIKKDDEKLKKKLEMIGIENNFKKEVQVHVFTENQFNSAVKSKNSLVMNILREGMSLKGGK